MQQTSLPWWQSRNPLWWHGFDESMPLEGWAAFPKNFPGLPLKSFNRFIKLREKLENTII
jgi:hypothetical protein